MPFVAALFLLLALFARAQEEKTIWDVYAQGDRVYLATGEGVRALDARLQERGRVGGFPAYDLAGDGNRLYAASDYGLVVLEDKGALEVTARLQGFPARFVAVAEGRAYLGGPGGLWVVDLSREAPKPLGRLGGYAVWGLAVEGTRA